MPASSSRSFRQVGAGIALELAAVSRIGSSEVALDRGHSGLGVARVVPPVRVVARGLRPARLAGPALGHDRAEVDHLGVAATVGDDLVDPGVELVAVGEDELRFRRPGDVARPRLVLVGVGVGLEDLVDRDGAAADLANEVADLGGGRDHLQLAIAGAGAPAAGEERGERNKRGDSKRRGPAASPRQRPRTCREREDGPGDDGDRRPGGRVRLDREPEADRALERDQGDAAQLPAQHPLGEEPRGQRRHDEERRHQQRADDREGRSDRQRNQAEERQVEPTARPGCCSCRVEAERQPALAEQQRDGQGQTSRDPRQDQVAAVDQQQTAEEQRLDVGAGAEDVAGEDRTGGEAANQDDRHGAVGRLLLAATEQSAAGTEDDRGAEGPQRCGEAKSVGQHQAREGGGADRV